MQTTDDTSTMVVSKLADLRAVPLAELLTRVTVTFDDAQAHAVQESQEAAMPVVAFSSAI
jgi:hypothetical protein